FYPRDFSMVCPTELTGASARIEAFQALECDVVGISIDAVDVHARWIATPQHEGGVAGLAFPLAADVDGAVAKRYGVFDEARGVALDRVVALKVFRPRSKGTIAAMLEEARLAASLGHRNVCTIYDVDDGEGVPLLAMECLEGATLSSRIADKSLAPAAAARVL